MKYNKRVKLVADLIETAKKHKCKMPSDSIKSILNDKDNKNVLGITDYKVVSKTVSFAEELIIQRKKNQKELY